MTDLNAEGIGIGASILGAGRARAEDRADHAVGVVVRTLVGQEVKSGEAVLEVHYRDSTALAAALPLLRGAIRVGDAPPTMRELILGEVR